MSTIDSKEIHTCWSKIKLGNGSKYFVEKFYQLMFEKYPETRSLFPVDMKKQNSALLNMLDNVISGIEYIDELEDILTQLGKRHQTMGIESKMYDGFIEVVVQSAKEASNYRLTNSEILAWQNAFRIVSDSMLKGY